MFFLLGGNDKKAQKQVATAEDTMNARVKDLFLQGKLPVVTTPKIEGKEISKVLGLVCCRGYDSEEAFFGMASRAVGKGAHGIVGYMENVAFHPDGSKYFSCFGTAVMFAYEAEERFGAAVLMDRKKTDVVDKVILSKDVKEELMNDMYEEEKERIRPAQGRAASSATRTETDEERALRRKRLSETRLGLDPEDAAPRKRAVPSRETASPRQAAPTRERLTRDALKEERFDPRDLHDEEPIRKFRTQ